MSRATPDDQLKFLLNCVKHSNNGKIDFVEVAKECGIVSKGAAAKRYERLMKANGIHPNGGPAEKLPTPTIPRAKSRPVNAKAAGSKKRKIEGTAPDVKADDADDGVPVKPKREPSEPHHVKAEPTLKDHQLSTIKPPSSPAILAAPMTAMHPLPPQHPPSQLFHASQVAYPPARRYQHRIAGFPGPLVPFHPSSALHSSLMPDCRYHIHPPGGIPPQFPPPDDASLFEDFCTPELFEPRTFLEMPQVQCSSPLPLPPQEVTMKDLSIEEKPAKPRSGKWPLESILIVD